MSYRSCRKNGTKRALVIASLLALVCAWSLLSFTYCAAAESGKRIVVSISDQVAYFIEDGFLFKSHIVSTGTDQTPTPLGTFSIYAHEYAHPTGSVIQYYTMFFYSNLGFHSVLYSPSTGTWTGGDTLGQKASHGCVRQALADAQWAYYWTPDGTQVDIVQEHFSPPPPKPEPARGGSDTMGVAQPSTTWYFAEGCTAQGFDQFLLLMNPQSEKADATISLSGADGTNREVTLEVPAFSRRTVHVNDVVGGVQAICASIRSDRPLVAERSMYFQYGQDLGGDSSCGSSTPAGEWYFAEGTCRPGFDTYLCIQNPGDIEAEVEIDYLLGSGGESQQKTTVAPRSRSTVKVKDHLGEGDDPAHDFSCEVRCTNRQNVIAERPMYFNYKGAMVGGHNAVGVAAPAEEWYFAEGTCRPGFDPYLCILNPANGVARVSLAYMLGDGRQVNKSVVVAPRSRSTIYVKDHLGEGNDPAHDFSCKVRCTSGGGIVVERPMYFNYQGGSNLNWDGGHNAMGVDAPAKEWYFAEGTCRPGFDPYLCVMNPGSSDAAVTITYMKGDGGTDTQDITVKKNSRSTVFIKDKLGEGDDPAHDFSCKVRCTSGGGIVVERPMYFSYRRY